MESIEKPQCLAQDYFPAFDRSDLASSIRFYLSITIKICCFYGDYGQTETQSLAQAERLRQSILKKAFEGRLVALDASDEPAGVLLEKIRKERELMGKRNIKTGRKHNF